MSTTISTHPITELEFPTVTVCPPRGSNTALNHLLEKVKDVNFTAEEKGKLLGISKEVFLEIPNMENAKYMTELLSAENMKSIANGHASMPEVDKSGMIILQSSEPHGNFSTPGFGKGNFYNGPKSFHYVLNFPENIVDVLGGGALVISVETKQNWSFSTAENRPYLYKLYEETEPMSAAEEFCTDQGETMTSIVSQKENDDIESEADGYTVWLNGRRKPMGEGWQWLDGRTWSYENWDDGEPGDCPGCDCLFMYDGKWISVRCETYNSFVCVNPPVEKRSGNKEMVFGNNSLRYPTLHFWWNHNLDSHESKTHGFKLTWKIENGSLPDVRQFVSQELSGSVSTPGLGALAPPNYYEERHEYTAFIELPQNITDVIGDGALIVDVDVTTSETQPGGRVELLTTEPQLVFVNSKMNWTEAEAYCVSKGGHLASVASSYHWHKLMSFMENKWNNMGMMYWLGGTDEEREGQWAWSDGRKWSEGHWVSDQPSNGSKENCLLLFNAKWYDARCKHEFVPICSLPATIPMKSDSHLVFTSDNISVPALQFRWVSQPISQEEVTKVEKSTEVSLTNSSKTALDENKQNTDEAKQEVIGGFAINWYLKGSNTTENKGIGTVELPWELSSSYKSAGHNVNILTVMNLVRESKIRSIGKQVVLRSILRHRWTKEILRNSPCLEEKQEDNVIRSAAQELGLAHGIATWIHEENLAFGLELYSILHYCPSHVVEAARLSMFLESLLEDHNLNTLVAATIHNIQPRAGGNVKDFDAVNMWYERLDKRYNLSIGPSIIGLMTTDNLNELAALEPPFLKEDEAFVDKHGNMSTLLGELKTIVYFSYNHIFSGANPFHVSHPPHLTSTWSSALIPFCAYKTDMNISENPLTLPGITYPFCSSFQPTMLEGQLCYKLTLNATSGQGKENELVLLLDYNEDRSLQTLTKEDSIVFSKTEMNFGTAAGSLQGMAAKVQIHTLSPYVGFGGGKYKMTVVKRMKAKADFLGMAFEDRNCEVELYENCRTQKLLEKCGCVPWEFPHDQVI